MIACECPVCVSADPKDNRLRSSILVESANTSFVVDTTPDFRTQMLRGKVKKLDAVLFTHPHKDHIAGLDDIKAFTFLSGNAMEVYANEITEAALKREFYYIFTEKKYPGIPEINLNSIGLEPFFIGDIPVIPILVWHLHMPVLGFRFGNFTYITDANRIEAAEMEKIKGSSVMVINALRHKKHLSHFTLSEALSLVQELKVPQAFFTHISHQLGKHGDVNAVLPEGVALAFDGLQLTFN
jgi:phosphoribosyl 1,2-cyclic phosphate phosphodiesterase